MDRNYNINLLNNTIRNIEIIYNDLLLLRTQSQNYRRNRRRRRNSQQYPSQQQYYPSQQQYYPSQQQQQQQQQYPSQQRQYPSQQRQYPSQQQQRQQQQQYPSQQQYYTPQYYYYPQQNTIRYPLSQPMTPIQTQVRQGDLIDRYTSDSSNVLLFTYFDTFPSTTPLRRNNNHMDNTIQRFYENVPIIATQNEIIQSTSTVLYNSIPTPLNTSCPITLETFNDTDMVTQIIGCGHVFDSIGINGWFQSNVRCPVCRYDIRTNSTQSVNNEQPINNTNRRTSTINNDLLIQYTERLMRELYPDF